MSAANEALDLAISQVQIRTTLTPTVTLDHPFASSGGSGPSGIGNFVLQLLRPEVVVQTALGPVTVAPAGDPPNLFPVVAVAALAAIGIGLYLLLE